MSWSWTRWRGKELMPDGASLSGSTEDEEGEPGRRQRGGRRRLRGSRRSGGDGGDEAGQRCGSWRRRDCPALPLARPKSLMPEAPAALSDLLAQDFPGCAIPTGLMSCGWCQSPPRTEEAGICPQWGTTSFRERDRNYKKTLLLRHHVSTEHKLHEANAQVRYMLLLLFQIFGKVYQLKLTLLGEDIFPVRREV